MTRTLRHWLAGLSLTALAAGVTVAQPIERQPVQQPAKDDGVEVLARGPVHEAFASTVEYPTGGGPVVAKAPPDAIEELPPDQKPDGDNVQWIPGYWSYDDDRADFIWISGFWRVAPPGRIWVSGSWREVRGGYQWVNGFWNAIVQKQQQAEIEYLPQPPALLELAPSTPAPTVTSFYTPGIWIYKTNRYAWRPGYWVEHRSNWIWVGDHYRWTPVGYIHVAGYWDYTPEDRGLLFAPVYFPRNVYNRQAFVYTPSYVVSTPHFFGALFVRRGYSSYYFGDYFEPRYATAGYNSWNGVRGSGSGFAVTVSVGRSVPYDPFWSYYSVQHRDDDRWAQNINAGYAGRYNGDIARPPRTLVQQTTIVNNITNVNNVNNNTNNVTNVSNVNNTNNVMLTQLKDVRTVNTNVALKSVPAEERVREQKLAKEITKVSVDRRKLETAMVDKGLTVPIKANEGIRTAKLDVPQTATIRAQAPETKQPPAKPTTDMKPEPKQEKPKQTPIVFPPSTAAPVKPVVPVVPPGTTPPYIKPLDPKPPVTVPPIKPPVTTPPAVPPVKPPVTTPPVVPPVKPPVTTPPVVPPVKPPVTTPPTVSPPIVPPPAAVSQRPPVVPPVAPPAVLPPRPIAPPVVPPPAALPPRPVAPPVVPPPAALPPRPVAPPVVPPPAALPPRPVAPPVVPPPAALPPRPVAPPVVPPPAALPPRPVAPPVVPPPAPKPSEKPKDKPKQ